MIFLDAILLSLFAGGSIVAGAGLGRFENIRPDWVTCEIRHGIMAAGGGALVAAVALVLVPEGIERQPPWLALLTFLMGGAFFMAADQYLHKQKSSVSQLMAMLLDFVPEVIVLGAIIAIDYAQAVFLAIIIAAQNFPEGFNAYREIVSGKKGLLRKHVFMIMGLIAMVGPVLAMTGMYLFDPHGMVLGVIMTFCAGGIFYLVFHDIAPQAKLKNRWLPSFGAVIGFTIGMIGLAYM